MRSTRFDDDKVGALLERFDEIVPERVRFLFDMDWDGGDAWGSLMNHYFAVNDVLWIIGDVEHCEPSYSPGACGPDLDLWPTSEYLENHLAGHITGDDLILLNRALGVLCHGLKLLGKDY